MSINQFIRKPLFRKAGNFLFFGLFLFVLINPSAHAFLLRQLMALGLFNAEFRKEAPAKNPSNPAAAFSYRTEKGETFSTANLKGKVVFINFWATWCPPCIAEMPALNDLYNHFRNNEQFVFLFINEDDNVAKAKEFLQSKGYAIPFASRAGNMPAEIFGGTLPTTVILNKESKIVFRHEGLAKYNSAEFMAQLKLLL